MAKRQACLDYAVRRKQTGGKVKEWGLWYNADTDHLEKQVDRAQPSLEDRLII